MVICYKISFLPRLITIFSDFLYLCNSIIINDLHDQGNWLLTLYF